ncbi:MULTISPECIES: hypothetical protein [Leisingera]|jgi:hypothetical protein|uniref:Lipoprotein n=1 Tax=Leisingera aquaemixtae TaxID=1396826 RepID=A0A0P1HW40_9RHOB|nr:MULTISPECIES: hypothetical protein [Leisingera]QDI76791.1 hypothetical protein R2C4_13900 [Leisingera aquaemixtae]UWQ46444.1 hypothetical protein K3719_03525 [Leisingera aquaemixtae]CUH98969.1 hypothetical protein PHA8399_01085 [Leisingera aquaemixtae]
MRNLLCLGAVLAALAGCAAPQQPNADAETLARVAYRHPGPPALTLYTMINNRTGRGGHTSLMINASERVIFDPAGSFYASVVPERDDVIHGITPAVEKAYRGAHARSTYHVVIQRIEVTPEQAEKAYRLALSNGRVPGAFCAQATIGILQQVPGFESLDRTFYPEKLAEQFGQLPGVVTERYYENDSGDLQAGLAKSNATLSAASE